MASSADDDRALLLAWRAGDRTAGNELFRRYFRTIYQFFRNKVDDGHRDLIQRTFLGCVESRDRVPDGVAFRTWLLGIAHNKLLHHIRKKQRERKAMAAHELAPRETAKSPSRVAALADEQRLLLRALRMLPFELQVTVELYYWEELRVADIGRVMGCAAGTVKSRLARARELLQEKIREAAEDDALSRSTIDGLERWARSLRVAIVEEADDSEES